MGTHRSGTSCVATLLASHPDCDATNHRAGEDQAFYKMNAQLLGVNDVGWTNPPSGALKASEMYLCKMRNAVSGWLKGDVTRILKDPRTAYTLPLWLPLMPEDEVTIVATLRAPCDSVRSLVINPGHKMQEPQARKVTLSTISAMIENYAAATVPKCFVVYEELLAAPERTIRPVCKMLGIEVEKLDLDIVRPELRHCRNGRSDDVHTA